MPTERQPCAFPGCNEEKDTAGSWCDNHLQQYNQRRHELEKIANGRIRYTNAEFIADMTKPQPLALQEENLRNEFYGDAGLGESSRSLVHGYVYAPGAWQPINLPISEETFKILMEIYDGVVVTTNQNNGRLRELNTLFSKKLIQANSAGLLKLTMLGRSYLADQGIGEAKDIMPKGTDPSSPLEHLGVSTSPNGSTKTKTSRVTMPQAEPSVITEDIEPFGEIETEEARIDLVIDGIEVHISAHPAKLRGWKSDDIRNYFKLIAEQLAFVLRR